MEDSARLLSGLKSVMKAKGITYKSLAEEIHLSEASVKRILASGDFSLKRLDKICEVVGVRWTDLLLLTKQEELEEQHLYTMEQEEFFSKNPKYLAFFDLLIRHGSISKIKKIKKDINSVKINTYLKKLESLGLIERHANDKIQFPVSRNVVWRKNGPLRRTFLKWAKNDFVNSEFQGETEHFRFITLELTERSQKKIRNRLEELSEEISQLGAVDKFAKQKTESTGIVLAQRPWIFSILEDC